MSSAADEAAFGSPPQESGDDEETGMHSRAASWACRVCGRLHEGPPWGEDGRTASFEICRCCGVEFGYEDVSPQAARHYRAAWLAGGAVWFSPEARPPEWSLEAQLVRVAPEFA